MRKALAGIAVAALATVGLSGTASAAPEHKEGEAWVCGGEAVTIIGAGRNGWIDSAQYHAVTIQFTGTFTPVGGTPQTETYDKTWANGRGLDDPHAVTCTTHFEETDSEGTFVGDGYVVAIPVHE